MTLWRRVRYYVPVAGWLPGYSVGDSLLGDAVAGATVACVVVPQALSYAQALVRVPPVAGLRSALVPLAVYALLGSSRQLAAGPEALVAILSGSAIRELSRSSGFHTSGSTHSSLSALSSHADPSALADPSDHADLFANAHAASLLCLMVGVFTFLLGFFRLGFLDSVLSRALLRGFVLAVACVVIIDMADSLLGIIPPIGQCLPSSIISNLAVHPADHPSVPPSVTPINEDAAPFQKLVHTLANLSHAHALTSFLSVASIAFLLAAKSLKNRFAHIRCIKLVPEILVLVLVSTILCRSFRWDCHGVAILNRISSSISPPPTNANATTTSTTSQDTLSKFRSLLLPAVLISVIGFVESIVIAKTYASKHGYVVSPNRELVALGCANIASSFYGGFPGFGSLGRSAVNDAAGARTQVAGCITGLIVACTIIWLLPYFEFLPKAVCSSIIVVAALKLIELDDVYFILRLHAWNDLGLLSLTFLTTIFVSIEVGTLISVGVSLLLVVKHTTRTRLAILGETLVIDPATGSVKTKFRSITEHSGHIARIEGGIVVRIEEGMFFGNVGQLKDRLKRIEAYGDLAVHPSEEPRHHQSRRDRHYSRQHQHAGQSNRAYTSGDDALDDDDDHGYDHDDDDDDHHQPRHQQQQPLPASSTFSTLFYASPTRIQHIDVNRLDSASPLNHEPRRPVAEAAADTDTETTPLITTNNNNNNTYTVFANPPPPSTTSSQDTEPIRSVVFDMTAVTSIDATATQILLEIVTDYHTRGILVCFVKLRDSCREMFMRSGIIDVVGDAWFFRKLRDAVGVLRCENRIVENDVYRGDGRLRRRGSVSGVVVNALSSSSPMPLPLSSSSTVAAADAVTIATDAFHTHGVVHRHGESTHSTNTVDTFYRQIDRGAHTLRVKRHQQVLPFRVQSQVSHDGDVVYGSDVSPVVSPPGAPSSSSGGGGGGSSGPVSGRATVHVSGMQGRHGDHNDHHVERLGDDGVSSISVHQNDRARGMPSSSSSSLMQPWMTKHRHVHQSRGLAGIHDEQHGEGDGNGGINTVPVVYRGVVPRHAMTTSSSSSNLGVGVPDTTSTVTTPPPPSTTALLSGLRGVSTHMVSFATSTVSGLFRVPFGSTRQDASSSAASSSDMVSGSGSGSGDGSAPYQNTDTMGSTVTTTTTQLESQGVKPTPPQQSRDTSSTLTGIHHGTRQHHSTVHDDDVVQLFSDSEYDGSVIG